MPNYWNIQTFTIYLQTFDQFWWSFAWWHILAIQSITVVQKVKFKKKSKWLTLPFKKLSRSIPGECIHRQMIPQKVSISFLSLPQNSNKSANNRFRSKCVKYSNFYNIFAIVWPILMKFHMPRHIRLPELTSDHQFKNFKIQVNRWQRTRKLRKISISIYSLPKNIEKSASK